MINFASFPVTLAGQQFSYLTEGMAVLEGLDFYEAAVVADLHEEWRETLAELEAAFAGIPGRVLADTSRELAESHPLDFETREALLIVLAAAPEDYRDAVERLEEIDEILADRGELKAMAWERQRAAVNEMKADGNAIQLRPDTSPSMRALLSIGGELERSEIRELMFNRTAEGKPIPGKYYARRQSNAEPTAYFGLALSPGKSVSARWAFADRAERLVIFSAHDRAVDKALRDLERDIGWVRKGAARDIRERGEMTWIRFRHETSRSGDPQINTHVVIPNVVRSLESDAVGSLDTWRAHGRINSLHRVTYHQELVRNLREAGINATLQTVGDYQEAVIDGIPPKILKALSQRREEGLAKAAELVGGDLSALSDYARKRVVNGAVKYLRPEKGEHTGDRATWEKRVEELAPEEWQAELRSGRMTSGAAQAYLEQRSEQEKPRPMRVQTDRKQPAPWMTRLYRVGPLPHEAEALRGESNVPEWLVDLSTSGAAAAWGRWFTHDRTEAEWYSREHPGSPLRFVDVPTKDVEGYLAVNQPGAKDFTSRPDHDFFLPIDVANKAAIVPESTQEKSDKPRPRQQTQAREMDAGGGGGDPSYRFSREENERER